MEFQARSIEDWNPRSDQVLTDFTGATDAMRGKCPVAFSEYLGWSVFSHADVTRIIHDHASFSNAVSKHLAVPNGMDPPEHDLYRALIEPYFQSDQVEAFAPICHSLAEVLLQKNLPACGEVEVMESVAREYALQAQCAFVGWPPEIREELREWLEMSRRATLSGNRQALREAADEFAGLVTRVTDRAREEKTSNTVTSRLLQEKIYDRFLTQAELTSIFRNWTVGELGTIAGSIGIIMAYLAQDLELQDQLRQDPAHLPAAIEEILRLDAPLLTNRRRVTRELELGGKTLPRDAKVTIMWGAANRDPQAFEQADRFCLDRDQSANLLYGAGVHVCPGAGLARLELRLFFEQLLKVTREFTLSATTPPVRAVYPAGGYSRLSLKVLIS